MIRRCLLLPLLVSLTVSAQEPETPATNAADARSSNLFGLDLYARFAKGDGNFAFSPYSVASALSMVYVGAAGDTAAEMKNALYLPAGPSPDLVHESLRRRLLAASGREAELVVANALWGQKDASFHASYTGMVRDRFGAQLERVDFGGAPGAAADAINGWVMEATHDRIRDLVSGEGFSANTRLVLTNAIYFKSAWAHPFDAEGTTDLPFHVGGGKSVSVPTMHQQESFLHAAADGMHLLEIPYEASKLSLVILLHDEGLAELEKRIATDRLAEWLTAARQREVNVFLPRFQVTSTFSLAEHLKEMGIKLAFSMEADFSGMNSSRDLYLAAVAHKAFVAVDEKGTEATAATSATMELKDEPGEPVVFRADRPFLFLIRERTTGCILFIGRVLDPSVAGAPAPATVK